MNPKLQPLLTPLAAIVAAVTISGTGIFIYQDFKDDFDKYQAVQTKAKQDELAELQSQGETLKQQAGALIDFDARQIAADEQRKLQEQVKSRAQFIPPPLGSLESKPDDSAKEIVQALNQIRDELSNGNLDQWIQSQNSTHELQKANDLQQQQQLRDMMVPIPDSK